MTFRDIQGHQNCHYLIAIYHFLLVVCSNNSYPAPSHHHHHHFICSRHFMPWHKCKNKTLMSGTKSVTYSCPRQTKFLKRQTVIRTRYTTPGYNISMRELTL